MPQLESREPELLDDAFALGLQRGHAASDHFNRRETGGRKRVAEALIPRQPLAKSARRGEQTRLGVEPHSSSTRAGETRRRVLLWKVSSVAVHARIISRRQARCSVPVVAGWDDVRRIALALPETSEGVRHGTATWFVRDKAFVWDRPLRKSDLEALGDAAPGGPILGARVEHVGAKDALIASEPEVFFTTPHFDGFPAVLIRLEEVPVDELEEVIVEAWLARAPKRLAEEYAKKHLPAPGDRPQA